MRSEQKSILSSMRAPRSHWLKRMTSMLTRKPRTTSPWDSVYDALAVYNAEKRRGVEHTSEKREEMRILQERFDDDVRRYCNECDIKLFTN